MPRTISIDRIYAALSAVNDVLIRSRTSEGLLQQVCDALLSSGRLLSVHAWQCGPDGWVRNVAGAGNWIKNGLDIGLGLDLKFSMHEPSEYDGLLAAIAFRNSQPIVTSDYLNDSRFTETKFTKLREAVRRMGVRWAAAIPLAHEGSTIGALVFYCDRPSTLDHAAIRLLERLTDNVSFTLDRLEQERRAGIVEAPSEWHQWRSAVIAAAQQAIFGAATREELCRRVCETVQWKGKFDYIEFRLIDAERKSHALLAAVGPLAPEVLSDPAVANFDVSRFNKLSGPQAVAFHTRHPCIINDFLVEDAFSRVRALRLQLQLRSAGAWPLLKDGASIGYAIFVSRNPNLFPPEATQLLQQLIDNISYALANFDRADERLRVADQIKYLATHDELTGLDNRMAFGRCLNAAIENSKAQGREIALLFIDLDGFKGINDTLGHDIGNALLVEISSRLRSITQPPNEIFRLGGDEFAVILNRVDTRQGVADIAQELLSVIIKPVTLDGEQCFVSASIGIAMFPSDGDDEQTLTKNADLAMYRAKDEGRNDFRFFLARIQSDAVDRLVLETGLRQALRRNEFALRYQPKVDLVTGRITGVEALLRWSSANLGDVPPDRFIPLTEANGLIVDIGKWVLDTACRQNMRWQRQGLPEFTMAVNLSLRQMTQSDRLLGDIDSALAESGMPGRLLELEITESMLMRNVDKMIEVLEAIRRRGVTISIDDFGTGHSSLSSIRQLPVDTLKVDRSFIRNLPQDGVDSAIAQTIITMGKALRLTVVAEGVETAEQREFLQEHGCDEMQGFLFSKPVAPEEIPAVLAAQLPRGNGAGATVVDGAAIQVDVT